MLCEDGAGRWGLRGAWRCGTAARGLAGRSHETGLAGRSHETGLAGRCHETRPWRPAAFHPVSAFDSPAEAIEARPSRSPVPCRCAISSRWLRARTDPSPAQSPDHRYFRRPSTCATSTEERRGAAAVHRAHLRSNWGRLHGDGHTRLDCVPRVQAAPREAELVPRVRRGEGGWPRSRQAGATV
eukprot:scaffold15359_cov104-Isochrysis_galbana.AAC.3